MKKVVVFKEPLFRRYSVPRLSFTYLFTILCNIFVLVLPFYFFTGTDGDFWMTHGRYREQPDVKFLFKFIMVLEANSKSTGQTKEIFVSTMDSLNALRPESYRLANINFHEDDADLDGMFDSFLLEAEVPLAEDEQVKSMQALLFFDLQVQKRVKFDMESVASTSFDSGIPISGYDTKGSLMLRQTNPLGIRDYSSTLYANETPLLDTTTRISDSNIGHILEKYRNRNVAADYVERYPIKNRAIDDGSSGTFHLKMEVNIPEQDILYIPTLMEVLKDGWIKYLSIFLLSFLLVEKIKCFAFCNSVLQSTVSSTLYPKARLQGIDTASSDITTIFKSIDFSTLHKKKLTQ